MIHFMVKAEPHLYSGNLKERPGHSSGETVSMLIHTYCSSAVSKYDLSTAIRLVENM